MTELEFVTTAVTIVLIFFALCFAGIFGLAIYGNVTTTRTRNSVWEEFATSCGLTYSEPRSPFLGYPKVTGLFRDRELTLQMESDGESKRCVVDLVVNNSSGASLSINRTVGATVRLLFGQKTDPPSTDHIKLDQSLAISCNPPELVDRINTVTRLTTWLRKRQLPIISLSGSKLQTVVTSRMNEADELTFIFHMMSDVADVIENA